ncbi:MAG: phosphoribosyltransferase [Bacteroidia bacterium]
MFKYKSFFRNREEAGLLLAEKLKEYHGTDSVVLAVPRGGVPVGYEIARELSIPLDIVLSKKIGHPGNKEYAIGSVSLDSVILDKHPEVSKEYIDRQIAHIRADLKKRYALFMGDRIPVNVTGKTVILVDDGIATGNTLLATIDMLRKSNPAKIIVAVPVVPQSNIDIIDHVADEFIYLAAPAHFAGVGSFFEDFRQVDDKEVISMLKEIYKIKLEH